MKSALLVFDLKGTSRASHFLEANDHLQWGDDIGELPQRFLAEPSHQGGSSERAELSQSSPGGVLEKEQEAWQPPLLPTVGRAQSGEKLLELGHEFELQAQRARQLSSAALLELGASRMMLQRAWQGAEVLLQPLSHRSAAAEAGWAAAGVPPKDNRRELIPRILRGPLEESLPLTGSATDHLLSQFQERQALDKRMKDYLRSAHDGEDEDKRRLLSSRPLSSAPRSLDPLHHGGSIRRAAASALLLPGDFLCSPSAHEGSKAADVDTAILESDEDSDSMFEGQECLSDGERSP